eukprot:406553-Amphidinium_carterae.1
MARSECQAHYCGMNEGISHHRLPRYASAKGECKIVRCTARFRSRVLQWLIWLKTDVYDVLQELAQASEPAPGHTRYCAVLYTGGEEKAHHVTEPKELTMIQALGNVLQVFSKLRRLRT